jgi:cytolysin-activating lysine-acyltransferase
MTPTDTGARPDLSPAEFAVIGEALALMAHSPLYEGRTLAQFAEVILPPLRLGQLRVWRRGGTPVGLATWAFLDDAAREAVLHADAPLTPDAWNSGAEPVVIDLIAPFGDGFAIARDLSRSVFPGRALWSVRREADGRVRKIVLHPGRDAEGRWIRSRAIAA